MPRAPRLDAPGVLHHVMAPWDHAADHFCDDSDRDDFVGRLGALAKAEAFHAYAWALKPNHY